MKDAVGACGPTLIERVVVSVPVRLSVTRRPTVYSPLALKVREELAVVPVLVS